MRALVLDKTLSFEPERADPSPGPDEVLVCVHLAGICATDLQLAKGYMNFQGILGHEFVGHVVSGPTKLRDKRVVAEINCVCSKCDMCLRGLASHCRRRTVIGISGRDGCFADYVAVPIANLHEIPDAISDEEAVFIEPLAAACQITNQCPIDSRTKVAVLGTGRLGLLVAQVIAMSECRLEVIGRNPLTLEFCDKKGIQSTPVNEVVPRADVDIVVDCTGEPGGLQLALQLVRPRGTVVLKSTHAGAAEVDLAPLVVSEVTLLGSRCGPFGEAIDLLSRKKVDVATMITKSLPFDRAIEGVELAAQPNHIKVQFRMDR